MNSLAHKAGFLFLCCLVTAVAQASVEKLAYQEQVITIGGEHRLARVPQGYQLELLTGALDGPRLLTFSSNGDLFIGSKSGKVYRLPPPHTVPQGLVTLGDEQRPEPGLIHHSDQGQQYAGAAYGRRSTSTLSSRA